MRIIAYTYAADVHCPECAREAYRANTTLHHPIFKDLYDTGPADEHGVGLKAVDCEGNPIHPVFDIDEDPDGTFTHCGDCRQELT